MPRERYLSLVTTLIWLASESEHVGGVLPYHAVYHHRLPELDLTVEEENVLNDGMCPTRPSYEVIEGNNRLSRQALLEHPLAPHLERAEEVLRAMLKELDARCRETGEDSCVIPEGFKAQLRERTGYPWR